MATDAVTGKPVANADIIMKGLIFKQKRKTDFDGKASFDVYVISTALTVSFEIVDTSSSRTHKTYKSTLTLTAGRDNYDMNVSLEPNSKRIGLKLADNNASPIVSAKLTLRGPSGNTLTAITDANGVANFDLPPGNAYGNASLSVEKNGYQKYSVPLDINDQTGQYSVIAPLQIETVTAPKATGAIVANSDAINSGMAGPTKNVDITSVDPAISVQNNGPYTPQCSGNPVDAVPTFPSWAVPPEKGFSDFLSDACIGNATATIDGLSNLKYGFDTLSRFIGKLHANAQAARKRQDQKDLPEAERKKIKDELIYFEKQGMDYFKKAKSLVADMISLIAGPEAYVASCFISGMKKYVESVGGDGLTGVEKLKKGISAVTETQKDLATRLDDMERRSHYQDVDFAGELDSMNWKTGYDRLSTTASALSFLVSFISDPKKLLPYEMQAVKAMSDVESMTSGLVNDCRIRQCDKILKDGIAAGQKALIAARRYESEMHHQETVWSDVINDWVAKNTQPNDQLRRWPYLSPDNSALLVIHDQYDNWVKFHNAHLEAEEQDSATTQTLKKLGELCGKIVPIAATLNQRLSNYMDLYSKGTAAIESCDFKKADSYIDQLQRVESGECRNFFPTENGYSMSTVLGNKEKAWKNYAKCDKEILPKGVTKYGPFDVTSKGWQNTSIQLKKGECFSVRASGELHSLKDPTFHFGPDGGGYWTWWVLKAKIGTQAVFVGSRGSGCADQDGVMELGTPTVNGFQEEAMQDLAGSLTVFVYVTHH